MHDGDTFTDNHSNKYRLFGVDAPEISDQYHNFNPTDGLEYIYAKTATNRVKSLIESKNVVIEEKTTDRYQRKVVKVIINNVDLGQLLVSEGLARVAYIDVVKKGSPFFSDDYSYYESLVWAQQKAYAKHLGVWRSYSEFKIIFPKA